MKKYAVIKRRTCDDEIIGIVYQADSLVEAIVWLFNLPADETYYYEAGVLEKRVDLVFSAN